MSIRYILSDTTCTVVIDNVPHQVSRSASNWDNIKEALNNPETTSEEMLDLVMVSRVVARSIESTPELEIVDGILYYNREEVHTTLARRILDILSEGLNADSWIEFAQNVYKNPLEDARNELYDWMEACEMPITSDGHILAYKRVDENYLDFHSGSFSNKVGEVVEMPREKVDPNRRRECSTGLHFCSRGYLPKFHGGKGKVLILKINPADVVAVPADYNFTKGRTCRYTVVGEIAENAVDAKIWSAVTDIIPETETEEEEMAKTTTTAKTKQTASTDTKTRPSRAGFETATVGRMTKTRFKELLREHGSMAAIARALGVGDSTVKTWKKRLYG